MKITPLEIRQKNFEKKLRGYDKDEVSAFLLSLSNEWERVLDENKELKIKLDQAQKEVQKLRDVESSLFKTLKTAEDTGSHLIDQANKTAELHMKEVQMNADGLMREAKSKAGNIIERAEQEARQIIEEMQDAVQDLDHNYKELENHRENVINELKNLATDVMDRLSRIDKKKGEFDIIDHSKRVKELVRASEERINSEDFGLSKVKVKPIPKSEIPKSLKNEQPEENAIEEEEVKEEVGEVEKKKEAAVSEKESVSNDSEDSGSFFDQIEE